MIVYVSGPMTGLPEYNYPAFRVAERLLRRAGHEVINPARGMVDGWTWTDYARRGVQDVCQAQAVALLPGWEASQGAQLEVAVARKLELRVDLLDSFL